MIAVDTNILVYAHRAETPWYKAADTAIAELAEGGAPWAVAWPCLHEFLAIVTSPRIFRTPTPLGDALRQIEDWSASPTLQLIGERPGYWDILKTLLEKSHVAGPVVHDARIAAICLQNGVKTLWSADRDFSRFAGLRVQNPVAGKAGQ